ncbi:hypothetical protein FHT28_007327 [Rhizobium sp. SG570]|nr:hypothetical protein [Rhizobium sp. SG570]
MIISVELVGVDGVRQRREIANVKRSVDDARLDDFGLSLEEAKEIQLHLQKELTQFQTDQAVQRDRKCPHCDCSRQVHDYRSRTIHSLFGLCRVRVPRWRRCECGSSARLATDCAPTLLNGRATPELERIQAELGSRLSFREAARVLDIFLPTARVHNHRTLRNRLGKVADQVEKWDVASPYRLSRAGKSPVSVFIDGAYIRAALRAQGWLPGRDVSVFSDGEVGLQNIVVSATRQPVTHILDWFHLSMRLRHIEQAWEGIKYLQDLNLYLRDLAIHMPRLRHLLWSGYVREASEAVKQMLAQLDQHPGFRDALRKIRRLYELIGNLHTYLLQNEASIVNYCRRY